MIFNIDLFRFIQNVLYIIEGYSVWIWNIVSGKTKQRAKYRYSVCSKCEHNKYGICEVCGCIIKAKVRVDFPLDSDGLSIDGCPEKQW